VREWIQFVGLQREVDARQRLLESALVCESPGLLPVIARRLRVRAICMG
jgi:hypothetical protein